jgi:hypothetical protein
MLQPLYTPRGRQAGGGLRHHSPHYADEAGTRNPTRNVQLLTQLGHSAKWLLALAGDMVGAG